MDLNTQASELSAWPSTSTVSVSAEVIAHDQSASTEAIIAASSEDNKDGATQRETYSSKFQYYVTILNNIADYAKVLRFPYLAFKNGGGAFCFAYLVMVLVLGMPMFFMKSAIAQFCSQGDIKQWNAVPLLKGVGLAGVVVDGVVASYYPAMITYSLYYLFSSWRDTLPWSVCSNATLALNISCSEHFWDTEALRRSSGLDETGPVIWYLALILMLVWMLTAGFMTKGVNAAAKVGTITAAGPLVVLVILMVYGLTLEGAENGIAFYIGSDSNMAKLQEPIVWLYAAAQICFTLTDIATPTSYSKFHNDMFLDTIHVCLVDLGYNVIAGFPIFCILGHMAHISGKRIADVAQEGYGLAFIAYAEALAELPYAPLWSTLFFLMLFLVGLGSLVPIIEVIVTSLEDGWPRLRSKRPQVTAIICSVLFLVGLPCVTRAGIYWVTLIDHYVVEWVEIVFCLMEIIGFIYIYGHKRLIEDIEMMIGKKGPWFWLYWKACWLFISPLAMTFILILSLITSSPPSYGDVAFPQWGLDLGHCLVVFCLIWIPIIAVYELSKAVGSLRTRVKFCLSPSADWHPYLDEDCGGRYRNTWPGQPEPDLPVPDPPVPDPPVPAKVISLPHPSCKTLNSPDLSKSHPDEVTISTRL